MTFSNSELMKRKRQKKNDANLKLITGVYVDKTKTDPIIAKQKVKELIKNLEGMDK